MTTFSAKLICLVAPIINGGLVILHLTSFIWFINHLIKEAKTGCFGGGGGNTEFTKQKKPFWLSLLERDTFCKDAHVLKPYIPRTDFSYGINSTGLFPMIRLQGLFFLIKYYFVFR